jgi:hypothetical protein
MVQTLYPHVRKWKALPVETTPGMGGGGIKENDRGVNLSKIYLIYHKSSCNATMYPHPV